MCVIMYGMFESMTDDQVSEILFEKLSISNVEMSGAVSKECTRCMRSILRAEQRA